MEKNTKSYSLKDLAGMLGITVSDAMAIGKQGLLSQILEGQYGLDHVTKCDDCQTSDRYTGDDEQDLSNLLYKEGR